MKLHELISPIDKHMDTEYGSKSKNDTNRLPKGPGWNLDKSDSSSNMTSDFTQQNALDILKSIVKKTQGKKPIFTTPDGTDVSVDAFGDEKSIKFNKKF